MSGALIRRHPARDLVQQHGGVHAAHARVGVDQHRGAGEQGEGDQGGGKTEAEVREQQEQDRDTGHHAQHADAVQQEHRTERELHGVRDIGDRQCTQVECQRVHSPCSRAWFSSSVTRARSSAVFTSGPGCAMASATVMRAVCGPRA